MMLELLGLGLGCVGGGSGHLRICTPALHPPTPHIPPLRPTSRTPPPCSIPSPAAKPRLWGPSRLRLGAGLGCRAGFGVRVWGAGAGAGQRCGVWVWAAGLGAGCGCGLEVRVQGVGCGSGVLVWVQVWVQGEGLGCWSGCGSR